MEIWLSPLLGFDYQNAKARILGAGDNAAPDSLQKSMVALMLQAAQGDAMDMRPMLAKFPIQLTSVRDYARGVLGARVAAS